MIFRMLSVPVVVAGLAYSGIALAASSDSQPLTAADIAQLSNLDQGQFDGIVAGGVASAYVQQFINERAAKNLEGGGGQQN